MKKSEKLGVVFFVIGVPMYFIMGDYNIIFALVSGFLLSDVICGKLTKFFRRKL